MTKVSFNGSMKGWSGRMGNLIFRLLPNGTAVVSQLPHDKKLKFSKSQKAHQERFHEAATYARQAAREQSIYAELAAGMPMKTAYNLAVSDWFNPPVIHQVQCKENKVLVQASDNIMVTKVVIKVLDEQGNVLEKGEAIRHEEDWWAYVTNASGQIIAVEAWDLARNVTKSTL